MSNQQAYVRIRCGDNYSLPTPRTIQNMSGMAFIDLI